MGKMIGLTGGIGSGKSTVGAMLAELGAYVVDADKIAHEIYEPGKEGFHKILERFGPGVLGESGSIDRGELGALVFNDAKALADLNAIIHPLVRRDVAGRIAEIMRDDEDAIVVIEAALMTETGWTGSAGEMWVVISKPEIAAMRLIQLRGMEAEDVRLRMAAQTSNDVRRRFADRVIENNGSIEDLEGQVSHLWRTLEQD